MASPRDALRRAIEDATEISPPVLCPEIRLRVITPSCALWHASEEEAEAAGFLEPFWAFCWAGGQAVARYLLDGPSLAGRRVLDFGCGGGVCGIAAARAGATVVAADIDPTALVAVELNAELNGVRIETTAEDLVGRTDTEWDLVLAGDVTYERDLTRRVIEWLGGQATRGADVLVGDPNRGFLATDRLEIAARYDAPADNDTGDTFLVSTTVYRVRCP